MAELFDLATAAASNTTRFPENMQFRNVNDGARELEAMIARTYKDCNGSLTASGSSNAFTVTANQTLASYQDRLRISFTANHTITGAATLNVSGLGAKSILAPDGSALITGDIVSGQVVDLVYRSSSGAFQMVSARAGIPTSSSTSLKVGDVQLTLDTTPRTGRIRLGETTQTVLKTAYPELDLWASGMSYPWGSDATTFTLPTAAGYFLRFAATSTAIDTGGARTAGSTQTDQNKAHTHTLTIVTDGSHSHTENTTLQNNVNVDSGGGQANSGGTTATTGAAGSHNHAGSSIASSGGDEVRVKNTAMHADLIASSALSNVGVYGVNGVSYIWDTGTTDADPGAGRVRINHATYASATEMYISETGALSEALGTWLATWDDHTSTIRGTAYFVKIGAAGTHLILDVSGSITDSGAYDKFTITRRGGNGTFANGDYVGLLFVPKGDKGDTGASGSDGGFEYRWDTSTTMADPGAGDIRLASTTQGANTQFAISASSAATGNPSLINWIKTWDDSSTTAHRGMVSIRKASADEVFIIIDITGAITDNTTWLTGNCTVVESRGSLSAADNLLISFSRTGDQGAAGAGTGDVTGPSSSVNGVVAVFSGTSGKAIQEATGSGIVKLTSGVLGTAAAGTDYVAATSGSAVQKANGSGGLTAAAVTDLGAGKHAIWIPAAAMTVGTSASPAVAVAELSAGTDYVRVLDFDGAGSAKEYAYFTVQMPQSWNASTITYRVLFYSTATDTDSAVWGLAGAALSDGDSITTALGTAIEVTDAAQSSATKLYRSAESSAVTIGGTPAKGDLVKFRLYRDPGNASDTMAEDARLWGIELGITTDAITDA